jgi:hypothetical protein
MSMTVERKFALLVTKDDPARGVRLAYELLRRETSQRLVPADFGPIVEQAEKLGAHLSQDLRPGDHSELAVATALRYVDIVFFLVERAMEIESASTVAA